MKLLYSIGIYIASFVLKLLSPFNPKLKKGIKGRQDTFDKLLSHIVPTDDTLWFHCASLGEYEQGLPVFEILKKRHSNHKIVLTFFSPSGYDIKKNTNIADVVVYMPLDTPTNAKRFLDIVHPNYTLFVKYEIWPNFLSEIKKRNLNAILISAVFRNSQPFFKWYGSFMRSSLFAFNHIFTQDASSQELLNKIGYANVSISGDTRFDRVTNQLTADNNLDFIQNFIDNKACMVFGSTWPEDDKLYIDYINSERDINLKYIIAPHNISQGYTKSLKSQLRIPTICYSEMSNLNLTDYKVLILDTIGFLSRVYSYADMTYVGGGAGHTGLHNILEPAVFGIPIIIGKHYDKFPEAQQLINLGGVKSVSSKEGFTSVVSALIKDSSLRHKIGKINTDFVKENKGAVIQILDFIRI